MPTEQDQRVRECMTDGEYGFTPTSLVGAEQPKKMLEGRFNIIWPEYRTVSEKTIRTWYEDAVANNAADPGLNDADEMARELSSIGYITLAR